MWKNFQPISKIMILGQKRGGPHNKSATNKLNHFQLSSNFLEKLRLIYYQDLKWNFVQTLNKDFYLKILLCFFVDACLLFVSMHF